MAPVSLRPIQQHPHVGYELGDDLHAAIDRRVVLEEGGEPHEVEFEPAQVVVLADLLNQREHPLAHLGDGPIEARAGVADPPLGMLGIEPADGVDALAVAGHVGKAVEVRVVQPHGDEGGLALLPTLVKEIEKRVAAVEQVLVNAGKAERLRIEAVVFSPPRLVFGNRVDLGGPPGHGAVGRLELMNVDARDFTHRGPQVLRPKRLALLVPGGPSRPCS